MAKSNSDRIAEARDLSKAAADASAAGLSSLASMMETRARKILAPVGRRKPPKATKRKKKRAARKPRVLA